MTLCTNMFSPPPLLPPNFFELPLPMSLTKQVYIKSLIHIRFLKCWTIFYHTFLLFQLVICIRHICPQTYEVYKDYIGLYAINESTADRLTCLIKDVVMRSSLPLNNSCGQCCDGAANMSGRCSGMTGVTKKFVPPLKIFVLGQNNLMYLLKFCLLL